MAKRRRKRSTLKGAHCVRFQRVRTRHGVMKRCKSFAGGALGRRK
jgi:hypothetical protein